MKTKKRIFVFHLLNDFSGSPKVLSQLLKMWAKNGHEVHLVTSSKTEGFLSDIKGVNYHDNQYEYHKNTLLRLLFFIHAQIVSFFFLLPVVKKTDLVYVNTSLPFAGSLLGKIRKAKVIYHIHESTINPKPLKWFLKKIITYTAHDIINVSQYVQKQHHITTIPNHLVYNALDEQFLDQALQCNTGKKDDILMICSLKKYKGVMEFVELAQLNSNETFTLVVNATRQEINTFFSQKRLPKNLTVFDAQKDVHPFYAKAKIVLNLSRPDGWIETFGLTVIEAMAYKIPVIVPPVGGIVEVIENEKTGFAVDSRNLKKVQEKLTFLLKDQTAYQAFSERAYQRLQIFTADHFLQSVKKITN